MRCAFVGLDNKSKGIIFWSSLLARWQVGCAFRQHPTAVSLSVGHSKSKSRFPYPLFRSTLIVSGSKCFSYETLQCATQHMDSCVFWGFQLVFGLKVPNLATRLLNISAITLRGIGGLEWVAGRLFFIVLPSHFLLRKSSLKGKSLHQNIRRVYDCAAVFLLPCVDIQYFVSNFCKNL